MKDLLYNIVYYPLPILWLFLIIFIFVNRTKLSYYLRLMLTIFYITLTPLFLILIEYPLINGGNNYSAGEKIALVLVPTAGIYKDNNGVWHPSVNTILRVSAGELMAKKLKIPLIISGGITNNNSISEADVSKKIVSYKNTIFENSSKNSYETVLNIQKKYIDIIQNNEKILLVTSPLHNLRMSLLLQSHGIFSYNIIIEKNKNITLYSFLPDVRIIKKINSVFYEYMAIIKYIYKKYIRLKF